jgi:hypothetical protein
VYHLLKMMDKEGEHCCWMPGQGASLVFVQCKDPLETSYVSPPHRPSTLAWVGLERWAHWSSKSGGGNHIQLVWPGPPTETTCEHYVRAGWVCL